MFHFLPDTTVLKVLYVCVCTYKYTHICVWFSAQFYLYINFIYIYKNTEYKKESCPYEFICTVYYIKGRI